MRKYLGYLISIGIFIAIMFIVPLLNPDQMKHNSRWNPGASKSNNILDDVGSIIHNLPGIVAFCFFWYIIYKIVKWINSLGKKNQKPSYKEDYDDDLSNFWDEPPE